MYGLLLVAVATALAMLLLVAFASFLFRENRTREVRHTTSSRRLRSVPEPTDSVVWRTVVDPTDDARATRPFAVAYARAMTVADAGAELPGHRAA